MLTTDQKGAIAESAVVHAAIKMGLEVYSPVQDGGRYDLIIDLDPRLLRVQCKWAQRHGDVIAIRCYSCRRAREGLRRRMYTAREVDVIAAYCLELDQIFLLEPVLFERRSVVHLRLGPTRNNQRLGINWAEDFDFAARLRALVGP